MNEDRRILRELEELLNEIKTLDHELKEWDDKIALLDDEFHILKKDNTFMENIGSQVELEKENSENTETSLIKDYFDQQLEIEKLTIGLWYMNYIGDINKKLVSELKAIDLFLKFLDCQVEFSSFNLFDTQIKVKCNMGDYISAVKLEIAGYPKSVSIEQITNRGLREVGFCVKRRRLAEFVAILFLDN